MELYKSIRQGQSGYNNSHVSTMKPSSPRAQTVYKQHTCALPIKCEPRSQFLTYAKECIQKKQEKRRFDHYRNGPQ